MKKLFYSRFWMGLVSIFFAMILFLTAVSSTLNNGATSANSPIETYTHSLSDVPIDLKYDSDKYFISEYSYGTQVYLTSTNRVQLDSEVNADTRNFKIVADLTKSKPGKVTVPLKVNNLPSGVVAKITPDNVTVTIGEKQTKTFQVSGEFDPKQLAAGYEIESIETSDSKVEVTSDESKIGMIDHVVAKLPENVNLSTNYNSEVTLQAVSADGTILASSISPAKTHLKIKVKKITKTVPVRVSLTGTMSDILTNITPKPSRGEVVISGPQEVLDTINEVVAPVDISGVSKNTSKTVSFQTDGYSVEPSSINVELVVKKKD